MNLRSTIIALLSPIAAMAAGSSAHYSLTADILDGAGTAGASSHYAHGGSLISPAGSGASAHYENTVGFPPQTLEDAAPETVASIITGTDVPGLPGAKFFAPTRLPSTLNSDAILAKLRLSNGTSTTALVDSTSVLVKLGDTLAPAGNAQISRLYAMSGGAFLAELKVGTGTPAATLATNKIVCFRATSGIELIARSGTIAPGGITPFKVFRACAGTPAGDVWIVATLNAPISADVGIWARPSGGILTQFAREGQIENLGNGPKPITLIVAMPSVARSPTEGRVLYNGNAILARFTQGKDHINLAIPPTATTSADWSILARTGGPAPGGIGTYLTLGIPATEGTNVAFKAALKPTSSVTSTNNTIIVANDTLIARKGQIAPGTTATYYSFDDPAVGTTGTSFTARLAGATTTSDTGLWESRASTLSLIAREGDAAPDIAGGVTIKAVTRFAHPSGPHGPIFTASLQGPGVLPTNNSALFATPATGTIKLARSGDSFDFGATTRTLIKFRALEQDTGNEGTARGYTENTVQIIGTFSGGISALVEFPVAP